MATGIKKAFIGLSVPFLEADLPVELSSGIRLTQSVGAVSKFWIEGLGRWKIEQLKKCNLVVVAQVESVRAGIVDAEYNGLVADAWRFVVALLLTGVRIDGPPVLLKGSVVEEQDDLRGLSETTTWLQTKDYPCAVVDRQRISEAEAAYAGIERSQVEGGHERLLTGLRSICFGVAERSCDERAYYFARALEATHASTRTDGKHRFVEKCCAICGDTKESSMLFGDLYDIRNNVVHVNSLGDLARTGETREAIQERVVAACRDAEIVCKEAYRRIYSDPKLLEQYASDESTRDYWRGKPRWDPVIDISQIRDIRRRDLESLLMR